MDGIELIQKIRSGQIKEGTKLKYTLKEYTDDDDLTGYCTVEDCMIHLGLFGEDGITISTVILINGRFELIGNSQ